MWIDNLPPFTPFFLAAAVIGFVPQRARQAVMLIAPLWGGLNLVFADFATAAVAVSLMDLQLVFMRADRLSMLFGYLFHIAAFIGMVYMLRVKDAMQQCGAFVYAGAALGAVFAGDLFSLFVFWELMAVSSVFLIWARRTPDTLAAGIRYLIIQVLSGVLLLGGALAHYSESGSLAFNHIGIDTVAGWLIFFAFGVKCAFPLLHGWLVDAYPRATPAGAVFLSALTTKTAVYALARGYAGVEVLVYIGAVMACFSMFYAVIENDLRRVLAYSLIGQLGFMVVGVGVGTALAINGAVAHAFTHVIYKSLLFMTMGAILFRVGHARASELGGLCRTMPKTAAMCVVGAASISAFPLFSGFVSKTMVMSAAIAEGYQTPWLALLFASAGVMLYVGIKVPYYAFFGYDSGLRPKEAPLNMLLAMGAAALLCVALGVQPRLLYSLLPWPTDYQPYGVAYVLKQLQLLLFAALAFVWLKKLKTYPPQLRGVNIDIEWLYRRALPALARATVAVAARARAAVLSPLATLSRLAARPPDAGAWLTADLTQRLMVLLAVFIAAGLWWI